MARRSREDPWVTLVVLVLDFVRDGGLSRDGAGFFWPMGGKGSEMRGWRSPVSLLAGALWDRLFRERLSVFCASSREKLLLSSVRWAREARGGGETCVGSGAGLFRDGRRRAPPPASGRDRERSLCSLMRRTRSFCFLTSRRALCSRSIRSLFSTRVSCDGMGSLSPRSDTEPPFGRTQPRTQHTGTAPALKKPVLSGWNGGVGRIGRAVHFWGRCLLCHRIPCRSRATAHRSDPLDRAFFR